MSTSKQIAGVDSLNNAELESIIGKLCQQAYDGWPGKTGQERADNIRNLLAKVLPNWSKHLGLSQLEVLQSIEKSRRVNAVNHYQESKMPLLDDVRVYEGAEGFKDDHKGLGFRCPSCGGVSTNPQECNADPQKCNWKSYGFLGCMGEGYRFAVKDMFLDDGVIYECFQLVAHESAEGVNK